MVDSLIAFGANEGEPEANFRQAIELLRATDGIEVTAVGEPVQTEPVGGPKGQPRYLNASIRLMTSLEAQSLHERLVEIETKLGRQRHVRWGSRAIDLDLLLYGDQKIQTSTLIVPHPRMSFRRFVLEPSSKIAGDMTHPTSGLTIAQLLKILDQRSNLAVWVNAPLEFSSLLNDSLAEQDHSTEWDFAQVSDLAQISEVKSVAKLMVVFKAEKENSEVTEQALKFAGPMLDLRSSDQPVEEVAAALDAIR